MADFMFECVRLGLLSILGAFVLYIGIRLCIAAASLYVAIVRGK